MNLTEEGNYLFLLQQESLPQQSMQRTRGKQQNGKDQRSLQENQRYQRNIHAKMSSIKDRNGMDLTEADDIKKKWQEYTEDCTKKNFMTKIITMV